MNTIYTSLPLCLFHFLDLVPSLSVCFPLSLSLSFIVYLFNLYFSLSPYHCCLFGTLHLYLCLYLSISLFFLCHFVYIFNLFLFICFLYFTKYRSLCFNLLFFIYLYLRPAHLRRLKHLHFFASKRQRMRTTLAGWRRLRRYKPTV